MSPIRQELAASAARPVRPFRSRFVVRFSPRARPSTSTRLPAHAAGAAARRRQLLVLLPPPPPRCPARTSAIARAARHALRADPLPRCALPPAPAAPRSPLRQPAASRSSCGPPQPRRRPRRLRPAGSVIYQAGADGVSCSRGRLRPYTTPRAPSPSLRPSRRPSAAPAPAPPTHGRAAAAAPICRPQAEGLPAALCGSPERAELARRVARPEAQAPSAYEPSEAPQGPAQRRLSRRRAGGRGRAQCWEQPLRTRPSLQALGERAAARESPVYIDA